MDYLTIIQVGIFLVIHALDVRYGMILSLRFLILLVKLKLRF